MYQESTPPLVPATTTAEFMDVAKWTREQMASPDCLGMACGCVCV